MKGGYKLLNLRNLNFTVGGAGETLPGVYNAIENSYQKALMISQLTVAGVEQNDKFCNFGHADNTYSAVIELMDGTSVKINITSDNLVTVAENA